MTWKRLFVAFVLCVAAATLGPAAFAQEPADEQPADAPAVEPQAEPPTPPPAPQYEPPKKKFSLYVEAGAGKVEVDPIVTSVATTSQENSQGSLVLDDNGWGRAVLGWKLRNDKGYFLGRYEGYKEESYQFTATGNQARVSNLSLLTSEPLTWWKVTASDGSFESRRFTPTGEDLNGDGTLTPDEITQDLNNPDLVITTSAPSNLHNGLQTFDALYQRDFGGRRYSGRWSSGLRYFNYEGNTVGAAWLNTVIAGVGFTDGSLLRTITYFQKSSGIGPTAHLELNMKFFRDRLVIYGLGRAAFMLTNLEVDTGTFFTLVRSGNELLPVEAQLNTTRDKSAWHFGVEAGLRFRLVDTLHLLLSYQMTGYQDVILMPTEIVIPSDLGNSGQGTSGVWKTQDYTVEGGLVGLSYQF